MNSINEVTFVIPTFNRNDYLIKILDTLPSNANVIVSDNGGAVTQEIIKTYKNFLFVKPSLKLEMYENWNFCINYVKTKWFIIPSDDDLYYKEDLYKIFNAIIEFENCGIIIFGHNVIDENDIVLSGWKPEKLMQFNEPFGYDIFRYGVDARLPSIVFNTETAKNNSLFKETYTYTAADSLLIQKCLLTSNSVFVPYIISAYRVWPANFTSKLISTPEWLERVDQWQDEVLPIAASKYRQAKVKFNSSEVKDEVYARNLIAGLKNLAGTKLKVKFSFFKSVRYPFNASLKTQINIIKCLISR